MKSIMINRNRFIPPHRTIVTRLLHVQASSTAICNCPKRYQFSCTSFNIKLCQSGKRHMNSWQGHGTDLLSDSLAHNDGVPKIILHGHSSTGFDVLNMIKNMDQNDENLRQTGGIVHCTGSILVLPSACFLWNVRQPQDLSVDSLAPILLFRPKLEYLFLGSDL